jgi:PIN domain nuclease of toxin-antitoxin system
VRVLVDTHIFIWAISDDDRLTSRHRAAFEDNGNDLVLSIVSVWEMLIKHRLGKLRIPSPAAKFIFAEMDRNDLLLTRTL